MLWRNGAKDHHKKRTFHKEQVNGTMLWRKRMEEKRGQVAWLEPLEQADTIVYIN